MSEPLVSALIITYNQEEYIEQAIESVLAQRVNFDYEIVIGEDCSTDKTREICLRYQEKYPDMIRVITSDKNLGLLGNWDRTVRAARGKYIASCAGDDYWHNPDKMNKQARFLEENPDYGMVHSDTDLLYEDTGRVIKNFNTTNPHNACNLIIDNQLEAILSLKYSVHASTATFRKEFFHMYFDLEILKQNNILMEDTPLWLEIAARSKIMYMADSFLTHREMPGTISHPHNPLKQVEFYQSGYRCMLYYLDKFKKQINNYNHIEKQLHTVFNSIILSLAFKNNLRSAMLDSRAKLIRLKYLKYLTRRTLYYIGLSYLPFGFHIQQAIYRLKQRKNAISIHN